MNIGSELEGGVISNGPNQANSVATTGQYPYKELLILTTYEWALEDIQSR